MRAIIFASVVSLFAGGLNLGKLQAAEPDSAPATIRVTLPADATLTVDGMPTHETSGTRWFTTPPLESGKRFFYQFKATFVRDGNTITVERKVPVRAGQESVVSLKAPRSAASMAQSYYYTPRAPAAPTTVTNYYIVPVPYFGGITDTSFFSEWEPGKYQIYNP